MELFLRPNSWNQDCFCVRILLKSEKKENFLHSKCQLERAIFVSRAENSLKSAKNVLFSIFCKAMGGGHSAPWLRYCKGGGAKKAKQFNSFNDL